MPSGKFGEVKSIKISKASWKLLRARSVDLERPMTALVEEAVTAYLTGHIPMPVEIPPTPQFTVVTDVAAALGLASCLHCHRPLAEPQGFPVSFCGEACRQAWEAVQP